MILKLELSATGFNFLMHKLSFDDRQAWPINSITKK